MKKLIILTALLVASQTACWVTAQEGTVQVRTINDKIDMVIRPESGGVYSWNVWWDEYYPVALQAKTSEVDVTGSSKDNAALTLKIAVTYRTKSDDFSIMEYLRKFGLDEKTREGRFNPILAGQVNTETKNAVNEFEAYGILANQEAIQARIHEKLKPIFDSQLFLELESVQIIGRPDFADDRIEQAASQVVANQKLKEAAQAGLEADRVEAERQQVRARTYENPALFKIRQLELQVEIAREWRQHNGTLVFGNSQVMTPTEK